MEETKILTETSRVTAVTCTAQQGEYQYEMAYKYAATGDITEATCSIYRAGGEPPRYRGLMSLRDGKPTVSLEAGMSDEIAAHAELFERMLGEMRDGIAARIAAAGKEQGTATTADGKDE